MKKFAPVLSVVALASSLVLAQDAGTKALPAVDWNGSVYEAVVNGNQVTVRSGPSENYYPITRLDKGTTIVVAGLNGDWVRIVPPAGAFSLVSKKFVTAGAGASTGTINVAVLNVRAGSLLNSRYETVQTKLSRGEAVTILGEAKLGEDDYYKIKPPAGAFLYIQKDLVAPTRKLDASAVPMPKTTAGTEGTTGSETRRPTTRTATTRGARKGTVTPAPNGEEVVVPATPPTTRQVEMAAARDQAEKAYGEVEQMWQEAASKPIDQQPIAEAMERFAALADNENLPVTLRQQAAANAAFLKNRLAVKDQIVESKRKQAEMEEKLRPLREQTEKLNQKFKELDMTTFTAVGQLENSALQDGGYTLLRLVDPATRRALLYVRTADATMVGQFVGIKGDMSQDETLNVRVITPRAIVLVDPAKVGGEVHAEVMPASMRPAGAPATQP